MSDPTLREFERILGEKKRRRNPEQVENLRTLLIGIIGPFALFMPADMVDLWGDRLQAEINVREMQTAWTVRVRMYPELPWCEIEPEPTKPRASYTEMTRKCAELISKYPGISEILITDEENVEYIISREGKLCEARSYPHHVPTL